MEILGQILSIFLLGLVGGAIPGPNLMAVFTETLRNGFIRGLRVLFRAIIAESMIAITTLVVLFEMDIPQFVFYLVSFFGAGVLILMALRVWKIGDIGGEGEIFSFKEMFFMTISNGLFWIFLITVCVPQAFLLRKVIPAGHILFFVIFELGVITSALLVVFLFSRFRLIIVGKKIAPAVFKIFSLILFCFAGRLVFESVRFFMTG